MQIPFSAFVRKNSLLQHLLWVLVIQGSTARTRMELTAHSATNLSKNRSNLSGFFIVLNAQPVIVD